MRIVLNSLPMHVPNSTKNPFMDLEFLVYTGAVSGATTLASNPSSPEWRKS